MKVVYASRFRYGSSKIVLTDRNLDGVFSAARKVAEISYEKNSHPSINYFIPRTAGQINAQGVFVHVSEADGLSRKLPPKINGISIDAELSEFWEEGINSLMDDNVLRLPEVLFSNMFVHYLVENNVRFNPHVVENGHWAMLAPLVYKEAREKYAEVKRDIKKQREKISGEDSSSLIEYLNYLKTARDLLTAYDTQSEGAHASKEGFKKVYGEIEGNITTTEKQIPESTSSNDKQYLEYLERIKGHLENVIQEAKRFSETGRCLDRLISALQITVK